MNFQELSSWGWDNAWAAAWTDGLKLLSPSLSCIPARVIGQDGPVLRLVTLHGPVDGLVSGRFLYTAAEADLPLVGDWVAVQPVDATQAVIHAVLTRRTIFGRLEGPVAANIDELAIVVGLDGNFSPRRALRLATLARAGGITPLWILSKADLAGVEGKVAEARRAAGDSTVIALSSLTGEGVDELAARWVPGQTIALTGSSGVGKTTLVNRLRGGNLPTTEVRHDSRGRHTTTSRHLYELPAGALLMDMPGFRAVGLWADSDDLDEEFSDVAALTIRCRFSDCRHEGEPGCAVSEALASGQLDASRWDAWRRQQREVRYLERREDPALQQAERDRWKAIHQQNRRFSKEGRSRNGN